MQIETSFSLAKTRIQQLLAYRPSLKWVGIVIGVLVVLLVSANFAMAWYYQDHYYPRMTAGAVAVGGLTEGRARQVLTDHIDRQPVVLGFDNKTIKVQSKDLGANYSIEKTLKYLQTRPKPAIPLTLLFSAPRQYRVSLQLDIDQAVFRGKIAQLIAEHSTEPQDAKLDITNGKAQLKTHQPGHRYKQAEVEAEVKAALQQLSSKPTRISYQEVPVNVTSGQLRTALDEANDMMKVKISLKYKDKSYQPSKSDIGAWLQVSADQKIEISDAELAKYVEKIGEEIDVPSKNEVVTTLDGNETGRQPGQSGLSLDRKATTDAVKQALEKRDDIDYELKVDTVEPTIEYVRKFSFRGLTYNYCVKANSVSADNLNHFSQKISNTLADNRGWGMGGQIRFEEVSSGCTFNLVLAAASTLPGYSSGCSIYWSCRVGANVIINFDRWSGASDSWNQAGGSLDEYQSMVINHEVGHWLGFDHWTCGGPGQAAPVMLQQSISLEGCRFNVWPITAELNALKRMKGI